MRAPAVAAVLLLLAAPAAAQRTLTPNTLTREAGSAGPAATVEQVGWIVGHWRGPGLGGESEEVWSPPIAGTMMGMYRLVKDGAPVFYEIMTLGPDGASLVLTLRHFHPDLTAWEEKDETVRFPLVRLEEDAAWFDGLTFRRVGPDGIEVFVAIGEDGGEVREARFSYRRHAGG